jgi:hypothetical protein
MTLANKGVQELRKNKPLNITKALEMRKLRPSHIKGVKNSKKNKSLNIIKAGSQTLQKFFVCCELLLEFKDDL